MKKLIVLLGAVFLVFLATNAFALTVSVASVTGHPGDGNISVPISISNFTATDLMNMELTLRYDTERLEMTEVVLGELTQEWRKYYKVYSGAGEVKIGLIDVDPLAVQAGTVAVAKFSVKSSAGSGQSNLTLTKAILKLSSADSINNGTFTVVGGAPYIAPIPASEVRVGHLLSFNIVATGDNLVYSATGVPAGASFNPGTHLFSWTPQSGQEGTYNVVFRVTDDQNRQASRTAAITVTPNTPSGQYTFSWEAETGALTSPMKIKNTSGASGGKCVYSPEDNEGSVRYTVNVPAEGDYRIWCRTKSSCEKYTKVFKVYIDGKEKYLKNKHEDSWEWLILKTEPHGSSYHYKVKLDAGTHTIVFKVREKKTYLDKLIITNNLDLEP